jgi:hypothetical protein
VVERTGWRLKEDELLAAASESTGGLTDLGGSRVWGRFCLLVRLAESGGVPAIARSNDPRAEARRVLVLLLEGRLRFVADEFRYPGIEAERIERPLIVTGIAGAGTEMLHTLLAADPGNRAPRYWELRPSSPPPCVSGPNRERVEEATRRLRSLAGFFAAGGMTLADCDWIWKTDAYLSGFLGGSDGDRYAFHRRFLRHLQFGGPRLRWVLRGTSHYRHLPALRETYPDAVVVWVHRDPAEATLHAATSHSAYEAAKLGHDGVSSEDIAAVAVKMLDSVCEHLSHVLSDPELDRVHHVRFADLVAEPMETLGGIYKHAGLAIGDEARRPLRDAANRLGAPSSSGRIPLFAERNRDVLTEYSRRFGNVG